MSLATPDEVNETIYLMCRDINPRFTEYVVHTSNSEILAYMNECGNKNKKEIAFSFVSSYKYITKYTDEELNNHFINKTKEFDNWCTDVAIFYVTRYLLLEKPIPIRENI